MRGHETIYNEQMGGDITYQALVTQNYWFHSASLTSAPIIQSAQLETAPTGTPISIPVQLHTKQSATLSSEALIEVTGNFM